MLKNLALGLLAAQGVAATRFAMYIDQYVHFKHYLRTVFETNSMKMAQDRSPRNGTNSRHGLCYHGIREDNDFQLRIGLYTLRTS